MVVQASWTGIDHHNATALVLLQGKITLESQAADIVLPCLLSQFQETVKP